VRGGVGCVQEAGCYRNDVGVASELKWRGSVSEAELTEDASMLS